MNGRKRISLKGVEVHNLKSVDLELPHGKLIVFCGVSGSGKSSLAFDTLYAEGQRRYIESFSAYTRQFLERLEKPTAERIDGLPPAIAVTQGPSTHSNRSTVATATELHDYLRLLFARLGRTFCRGCGQEVRRDTPQSVSGWLAALSPGTRFLVAFPLPNTASGARSPHAAREVAPAEETLTEELSPRSPHAPREVAPAEETQTDELSPDADARAGKSKSTAVRETPPLAFPMEVWTALREAGFVRVVAAGRLWNLAEESPPAESLVDPAQPTYVVVDRLAAGGPEDRLRDSVETAFEQGDGRCAVFVEGGESASGGATAVSAVLDADTSGATAVSAVLDAVSTPHGSQSRGTQTSIDGRPFTLFRFSTRLGCEECGLDYADPEPRLFSYNSPLGACPRCEGFGNILDVDPDLVVPDATKSLAEGAIQPWNTPAYAHELQELLALAPDYGIRTDVPFAQLTADERRSIDEGVPERKFGGLRGFFAWLERRKYKMHIRAFLSRWRSHRVCPECGGARLQPAALSVRVGERNIAEVCRLKVADALPFVRTLELSPWERNVGRVMLDQIAARLGYLAAVGLAYLPLDRTLRSLSGGEAQRVALTAALGSSLVNMLYVLDEPSVGLHPHDTRRLVETILGLRDRGNTVVVVDHDEDLIRAADQVVEIGPGAGDRGGRVVFQGTPREMEAAPGSLTGDYLAGRRALHSPQRRRAPNHGWIRLAGARGNNLQNLTVEFPLGVLCVVTGVSGSGKSTLVEDTLYPALCRRMRKEAPPPAAYDDVYGDGQLSDVLLVDQSPIGRSSRSNPVTYIKAFDEIRAVFAETLEARTRNYTASHFSFNVEGGRCEACEGEGRIAIDMQFLADVYMNCPQCHGTRYRREILEARVRGLNIAEVLEMTVREGFAFFRGQKKVQARLKKLMDVGLDYIRLGQPAGTLSGGEAQRLKLAGYMSAARKGRTLFLLDEPTTGLHAYDVVQLIDCFEALLAVGHSLIVVEHNLQLIKYADHVIDLGPGAAEEGGRVVAVGTPEGVARVKESVTGRYLARALAEELKEPA